MSSIKSLIPSLNKAHERFSMEGFVQELQRQKHSGTGLMTKTFDLAAGNEDFSDPSVQNDLNMVFGELESSLESLHFADMVGQVGKTDLSPSDVAENDRIKSNMKTATGFISAILMNGSVESYMQQQRNCTKAQAREGERVAQSQLDGPAGYIPVGSLENYDEKPTTGFNVITIAYNLSAARQDAFGERLYPTLVVAPTEGGISQKMSFTVRIKDVPHKSGATDYDLNDVNLVDGFRDPEVLEDTVTRAIPVYDDKTNANLFVASTLVAPTTLKDDYGTYRTAPLKAGQRIDLIGNSNRERWLNAGQMDVSDTLDPNAGLSAIYVKVGDKVLRLVVDRLPNSRFQAVREGDSRSMYLAFTSRAPIVTKKTTAVDGTTIPALAAMADGDYAFLSLDINGNLNLRTGSTGGISGTVSLHSVFDKNGAELPTDTGTASDVAKAFATAEVVGYDPDLRFTNKNRRERGQIIQTRTLTLRHAIPMGAPITNIGSTLEEANETAIVSGLTAATNVRNSNNAVSTLLNYAAMLSRVTANNANRRINPEEIEGIMAVNMNPTYRYVKLDLRTAIDSIRGKDRLDDIGATILNTIRSEVFPAIRDANILPAFQLITGNPDEKPLLVIATDNEICNYLMISGDVRTMGANLKYEIVSTQNKLMDGKIICVLTRENPTEGDVLNFGQFLYVPSLVGRLPISRNGQVSREIAVAPFNKHINNIPFVIEIDVVGLKETAANGAATGSTLNGYDNTTSTGNTTGSTTTTSADSKNGG